MNFDLYTFNSDKLKYAPIKLWHILIVLLSVFLLGCLFGQSISKTFRSFTSQDTVQVQIPVYETEFSEEALWDMLNNMNVKYPHIVLAQSMVETEHFKSNIFKENNNLFGMKISTQRCSTHGGSQFGHARYHTWQESVIDYAFYQTSYLRTVKSEPDYFDMLYSYAEDTNYVNLIKNKAKTVRAKYEKQDKYTETK